jgi:peroxiredoxin
MVNCIDSLTGSGSTSERRSSGSGKGGESESDSNNDSDKENGDNSLFNERGLGALGVEDSPEKPEDLPKITDTNPPTATLSPMPPTPTKTPIPATPTDEIAAMPYDFTVITFDGGIFSLENHRGKVVVINYWAHWCGPCRAEADEIQEAWEFYSSRGDVVFLGLTQDKDKEKALDFIEEFGFTFPNAPDIDDYLRFEIFMIGDYWPTTLIIDQTGDLVDIKIGSFTSLSEIKSTINPYLE